MRALTQTTFFDQTLVTDDVVRLRYELSIGKNYEAQLGRGVFQHALGLNPDIAGDEVAIRRVDRNLASTEEQITDANGVIVRADCGGRFCGFDDDFLWHGQFQFCLPSLVLRTHQRQATESSGVDSAQQEPQFS